jgi:hypothetical protein
LFIREIINEKDMTTPITKKNIRISVGPPRDNSVVDVQDMMWSSTIVNDHGSLNNRGTAITFDIPATNQLYPPSNAYLNIEGQLFKVNDSTMYAQTDRIAFQNNNIVGLFSPVQLQLGNNIVEQYDDHVNHQYIKKLAQNNKNSQLFTRQI